jgi:hypothetical protein
VVDGKTNEITAFAPLADRIDITGAIITADALHTQHRHADYLISRGAHYVLTVKRNQPSLHRQLRSLPGAQIPAVGLTHDKGHGRIETRADQITNAIRGQWGIETACTGSATLSSPKTTARSAPGQAPPSWPPCATSPSACTDSPAQPISPPLAATSAATPTASCRYSHNGQINFAEALGLSTSQASQVHSR